MSTYTAMVERDAETGLFVGFIPGIPGAYTQGETPEALRENLREVLELLTESGDLVVDSDFVGTQQIVIP